MNLKRSVWLPPDGDSRLVRFQQDLVVREWFPGGPSLPPHLELLVPPNRPSGAIESGSWILREGEPVLEAFDSEGFLGVFRFGLAREHLWSIPELDQLPIPPPWKWLRGITAVLVINLPQEDWSFILWTWESRRGWKADSSKA